MGGSHKRAPIYFTESINSSNFIAVACNTFEDFLSGNYNKHCTAVMGENVDIKTRGKYYLTTNGKSPFALGSNILN